MGISSLLGISALDPIARPMKIKEQIEKLRDWANARREAGKAGYGIDVESFERALEPPRLQDLSVADLKALAASHTALVEAAKDFLHDSRTGLPCFPDQLEQAISEAEKL